MKILNLYAGIGGNRKLWGDDHEIWAIENNEKIAQIYANFFPNDKVKITDAHDYLLKYFEHFDFIWSSPPCPTHSKIRKMFIKKNKDKPVYPDMKLYEEILLLQGYFKGKWVVENVVGWYKPLVVAQKIGRHYFWANFFIGKIEIDSGKHRSTLKEMGQRKGFDLSKYRIGQRKDTILRNCVLPGLGLHIFKEAFREQNKLL